MTSRPLESAWKFSRKTSLLPPASRYGLAIGAYCSWFVNALKTLVFPIAYPISRLLDAILGTGHTALFRRAQLKALVDIHGMEQGLGGMLSGDEIKIITGASGGLLVFVFVGVRVGGGGSFAKATSWCIRYMPGDYRLYSSFALTSVECSARA